MRTEKYRGWLVAVLAVAFALYGWSVWNCTENGDQWFASGQEKVSQVNTVDVTEKIYAIGTPVGIYLETEGVLVADVTQVETTDGEKKEPCYLKLQQGDYITAMNGTSISTKEELINGLQQCGGQAVTLDIRRNDQASQVEIQPAKAADGTWQLGIWARDNMQGIGILTYITNDGKFGALGHGIHDTDTGEIMEISRGLLYESTILDIEKGAQGKPGELMGMIDYRPQYLEGTIDNNTTVGIFGHVSDNVLEQLDAETVEILPKNQVRCGDAVIRTCINGQVSDYSIRITALENNQESSGMIIEVTDERLLKETGGIIQGMSGSPIIMDDKIVGAVTHVFVNDPTKGYGIFIENMLGY